MPRQYLDVPYRAKDAAKALGARFDGAAKRWYVETGVDLVAFAAWLPAGMAAPGSSTGMSLVAATDGELSAANRGISLSRLLSGVSAAVARAFDDAVWTLVEVSEASMRNGHVYLDLSERDGQGQLIAKARGTIWASTAARILPDFERATGAVVGAGIKLLVRARPVFKSQFGFSLDIDAIDAAYTLGDLEARKKEIRARLQQEGVFDRNRLLVAPWDYRLVLVVAPQDAAGLGDFRKEAERLERFGLCRFVYAHSRFQGEGAAGQIMAAAAAALAVNASPDALVLIRGGGAVNDLAWLNDYALARFICDQAIPVLTGIGHERDSTLPDEVAHLRFDTPSKVIAGIEQQIRRRAQQAGSAWETVLGASAQATRDARLAVERREAQVRADARDLLARARRDSQAARSDIAVRAVQQGHAASRRSLALMNGIRSDAEREVAEARRHAPALLASIRNGVLLGLGEGRACSQVVCNAIIERAAVLGQSASHDIVRGMHQVVERAHGEVRRRRDGAQALMREIAGQGPEKTLARGFAIVRTEAGRAVVSSAEAGQAASLTIQFEDGTAHVRPHPRPERN